MDDFHDGPLGSWPMFKPEPRPWDFNLYYLMFDHGTGNRCRNSQTWIQKQSPIKFWNGLLEILRYRDWAFFGGGEAWEIHSSSSKIETSKTKFLPCDVGREPSEMGWHLVQWFPSYISSATRLVACCKLRKPATLQPLLNLSWPAMMLWLCTTWGSAGSFWVRWMS